MYRRTKKRIEESIDSIAPDLFSKIQQREVKMIETEDELFCESEIKDNKRAKSFQLWYRWAPAIVIMIVCAIFIGKATMPQVEYGAIFIDVNPSIKISYEQRHEKVNVTKLEAVNHDGDKIIKDVKIEKGKTSLDKIVNDLFRVFRNKGYITKKKTEVIISYYSDEKNKMVEKKVKEDLINFQKDNELQLTVFYQDIRESESLQQKANEQGISIGKYIYIENIAKKYHVNPKRLYKKSVHDINKKIEKKQTDQERNKKQKIEETTQPNKEETTAFDMQKTEDKKTQTVNKRGKAIKNTGESKKNVKKEKQKPKKKQENQSQNRNENATKVSPKKNSANKGATQGKSQEAQKNSKGNKPEELPMKEKENNRGKNK